MGKLGSGGAPAAPAPAAVAAAPAATAAQPLLNKGHEEIRISWGISGLFLNRERNGFGVLLIRETPVYNIHTRCMCVCYL